MKGEKRSDMVYVERLI
uniref:Uncharacterized protein n=1 Tax=Arundo donax TaxID=35708 RepID=A0A0A9BI48_ARUDO